MLEANPPSTTFHGVCFVLFGFDSVNERQVRFKLVNGGGVDAGNYSENCTHVIVDKIIYDDPICVAARNDGKTLVTALWVDHSFDIGMPCDASSIMYCPLKDLDGIPGAKSLTVCLTGYVRQDRDDIMTMVGLMGAQFSKPLVANKVTHLVCYKFEGEKYELASKMKRIKLVNHRWLEDCLRKWELLPENNYNKSGHELEIMDAEAKDSEEDVEDNAVGQLSYWHANKSPGNLRLGTPRTSEWHKSTEEVPMISRNLSEPEGLLGVVNANNMPSPGNKNKADHAAGSVRDCVAEVPGCLNADASRDATSVNLPGPQERTPKSLKVDNGLSSSVSAERSPLSTPKFNGIGYTRKTKIKSPSSMFSIESGNRGSPEVPADECNNISPARVECREILIGSGCVEIPLKESRSSYEEASSSKKQKMDVSCSSSRSQISHDAQACVMQSSSIDYKTLGLESASKINGLSKTDDHSAICKHDQSVDELVCVSAGPNLNGNNLTSGSEFKEKPLGQEQRLFENMTFETGQLENTKRKTAQTSSEGLIESNVVGKPDNSDFAMEKFKLKLAEAGSPHNHQQDGVPSLCNKKSETEKLPGGSSSLCSKPFKKKTIANKTLGSRPNMKSNANEKGSIYLNKATFQNDPTISLTGGEVSAKHELSNANELETFTVTLNVAAVGLETRTVTNLQHDILSKADFMDDETEGPDTDVALENIHNGKTFDLFDLSLEGDEKIETKLEVPCVTNNSVVCKQGDAEEDKNVAELKEEESNSKKDGMKGEIIKRKRCIAVKTKTKNIPAVSSKPEHKKVLDREKNHSRKNVMKKEKGEPSPLGETKSRTISGKRLKNSTDAEKENKLSMDAGINISETKENVETHVKIEPVWFILSGHRLQRKEFQQIIRRLKGKICRDSHQWTYQATHFIAPDPIRRTEKFFAAAASGRWILKTDYLTACSQEGRFLAEEPYEWHRNGLSEDGAINLEAPRKWRLLRERTGRGAFYGMRIIVYGECIAPPLDTLKRVVKAGDGTILATSPPYTRFLTSGIDYAVVSPGMPRVDLWVQEFLKHEIPCVVADYLVELVCKPGYSLDRHALYNTHAWAEKSFANLLSKAEANVGDSTAIDNGGDNDVACQVCGSYNRGEVMLICGDDSGSVGCGVGMHIDCCNPPLLDVPEEDWFCPKCAGNKDTATAKKKRTRIH